MYNQKLGTPAVLDRQLLAEIFDAGVAGANDLLVISTGGSRSVSIPAGACYVPSTQGAGYQGTYRTYNDAAITRTHDAASTFPRLDQIVMRVYDSTTLGSGALDEADIEIVKGTEASGATVVNRTGAVADGSLPPNVVRLADVLVPVGASPVIPSANIVDRRPHAGLKGGGSAPIGTCVPYCMGTEPTDGHWSLADGGLIDKTVYKAFFDGVGHAYNAGADPGSNKVRKPDKRGRGSVGADNMGTSAHSGAAGAASRLTTAAGHSNVRGQNGGEERHTPTLSEMYSHAHPIPYGDNNSVSGGAWVTQYSSTSPATGNLQIGTGTMGSSSPFNLMQPYEADLWIVRIA